MDIDVWVTTLPGKVLYHKRAPDHGKLSFQTPSVRNLRVDALHPDVVDNVDADAYGFDQSAEDEDTFRVCVEHQDVPSSLHDDGAHRAISLRLGDGSPAHTAADAATGMARAHDANRLVDSVLYMHEGLTAMVGDLSRLEARERALIDACRRTGTRVSVLAMAAVASAVAVTAAQSHYYGVFFKQNKLC